MGAARLSYTTAIEYLDREREAEFKSEYAFGEIVAMAGGGEKHDLLMMSVGRLLGNQFVGRTCRVHGSDMRVQVVDDGMYTYPDASALCGKVEFLDDRRDTLLNPSVIFEVLSPSTEMYDRTRKFFYYQRLESLREYVLISQDQMRIEVFVRAEDGRWIYANYTQPDDVVRLESVDAQLRLADVYDKVEFEEVDGAPPA